MNTANRKASERSTRPRAGGRRGAAWGTLGLGALGALGILGFLFSSCGGEKGEKPGGEPASSTQVVVYCALDRNFAEPLLQKFEKDTGMQVDANFDVEATKTVGLVRRIEEERVNPRCDVFWNNEIVNTIRLKKLGALAPYRSPNAASIPAEFKDPDGCWTGFAARARIFIINTDLLPSTGKRPSRCLDLIDPVWKGMGGMAKPLTGTTATHGVVLFQELPESEAEAFFRGLITNDVHLTAGNAHVMRLVRKGEFAFGFTDTDDYNVARSDPEGFHVDCVYPDQEEGGMGTLLLPNTVAMVAGGPHPDAAKKLIDYLLSPEVEEALAFSDSAQIPLHPGVKTPDYVKVPGKDFRAMKVDFEKAAEDFDRCQEFFRKTFL